MDRTRSGRIGLMTLVAALAIMMPMLTSVSHAEEGEAMEAAETQTFLDRFSFEAGFEFTNKYYFRGIFQENQDVIFQPYFDVGFNVFEDGDGFFKSLDVYVGTWSSVHGQDTGSTDAWYEADYYFGFTVGLPANFSFDLSYVVLDTPDSAFGLDEFAEEIDMVIAYDDSGHWEGINIPGFEGFQPYFLMAYEVQGGSDGFGNDSAGGMYFEFGIAPSMTILDSEDYPITLTIPVTIGLGSNYYQIDVNGDGFADDDDSFGYFDIGLDFSMPLPFMPSITGEWTLSTGVHLLVLGNNNEFLNSDGDKVEVIGKIGLSTSF